MSAPEDLYSEDWWIWTARVNLESAEHLLSNPNLPSLVATFHSQQAAEKAIKGALVWLEVEFPFTHNLETLMRLIPADWELHKRAKEISDLTEYSSRSNYHGNLVMPTRDEAQETIAVARFVIESVETQIV